MLSDRFVFRLSIYVYVKESVLRNVNIGMWLYLLNSYARMNASTLGKTRFYHFI